jgi:hypothetical protein
MAKGESVTEIIRVIKNQTKKCNSLEVNTVLYTTKVYEPSKPIGTDLYYFFRII